MSGQSNGHICKFGDAAGGGQAQLYKNSDFSELLANSSPALWLATGAGHKPVQYQPGFRPPLEGFGLVMPGYVTGCTAGCSVCCSQELAPVVGRPQSPPPLGFSKPPEAPGVPVWPHDQPPRSGAGRSAAPPHFIEMGSVGAMACAGAAGGVPRVKDSRKAVKSGRDSVLKESSNWRVCPRSGAAAAGA